VNGDASPFWAFCPTSGILSNDLGASCEANNPAYKWPDGAALEAGSSTCFTPTWHTAITAANLNLLDPYALSTFYHTAGDSNWAPIASLTHRCVIPNAFADTDGIYNLPLWRSDYVNNVKTLNIATNIFAPNTVFFAISNYYSRQTPKTVAGGCTFGNPLVNVPTSPSVDCSHTPFSTSASECNGLSNGVGIPSRATTRAYLKFSSGGPAVTPIVFDFFPEKDIIDLTTSTLPLLDFDTFVIADVPNVASNRRQRVVLSWGGTDIPGGAKGATKTILITPVNLPKPYEAYTLTSVEIVDITGGDDSVQSITKPATGNTPANAAVCLPAGVVSKVETLVWGISVFSACSPFTPTDPNDVGLP